MKGEGKPGHDEEKEGRKEVGGRGHTLPFLKLPKKIRSSGTLKERDNEDIISIQFLGGRLLEGRDWNRNSMWDTPG